MELLTGPSLLNQRFVDLIAGVDNDRQDQLAALLAHYEGREARSAAAAMAWPHGVNHRLADAGKWLAGWNWADIVGGFLVNAGQQVRHAKLRFDAQSGTYTAIGRDLLDARPAVSLPLRAL